MAHEARRQVEQRLYELAEKDPSFRQQLASDPKGAISQLFGGSLPDDLKVQVHQEDANTVHIVLPNTTPVQGSQKLGAAQVLSYLEGFHFSDEDIV